MITHHHASIASGQVRTDIRINDQLFNGPTIDVAKRLVGALVYRRIPHDEPDGGSWLSGRIVETEAYLPLVDPTCHGYHGPTKRTATLFGWAGHAYVYLIYGMHYCLNVTTEPAGIGAAVLIRAVEPIAGIEAMRQRRGGHVPIEALASGPGNLCRAMSIDLRCDGADLRQGDLIITPPRRRTRSLAVSGRMGLSAAQQWPLRFFDSSSPSISPFRKARIRAQENGAASR